MIAIALLTIALIASLYLARRHHRSEDKRLDRARRMRKLRGWTMLREYVGPDEVRFRHIPYRDSDPYRRGEK